MRCRLTRIILFLVLGAIVNVAVAWGCAMQLPPDLGSPDSVQASTEHTEVTLRRQFGDVRIAADVRKIYAMHFMAVSWNELAEALPWGSPFRDPAWVDEEVRSRLGAREGQFFEHLHGWPMLSMHGRATMIFPPNTAAAPPHVQWEGLYEIVPLTNEYRLLPLRPIWPGVLFNTCLYAAMLAFLVYAPGSIRRTLRRRRGQCVTCGYDRRGNPCGSCPECGRDVASEA